MVDESAAKELQRQVDKVIQEMNDLCASDDITPAGREKVREMQMRLIYADMDINMANEKGIEVQALRSFERDGIPVKLERKVLQLSGNNVTIQGPIMPPCQKCGFPMMTGVHACPKWDQDEKPLT